MFDNILNSIHSNLRALVDGHYVSHISYADDFVPVAGSIRSLQRMLEAISVLLGSSGLPINIFKS